MNSSQEFDFLDMIQIVSLAMQMKTYTELTTGDLDKHLVKQDITYNALMGKLDEILENQAKIIALLEEGKGK